MTNVVYTVQNVIFEWDNEKASANWRKHAVSLESAVEAFFDPFLLVVDDEEYVGQELREKVIGMTRDWQVILVVYVMRSDRVRLISARVATGEERRLYENQ